MPSRELLAAYADVAIQVGVGLAAGDRLLIHSSVSSVEFTRMLVERAYEAGATNVDVLWADDAVSRSRFEHGTPESWKTVSTASRMRMAGFEGGDLMLYVDSRDPDALAGIDPHSIAEFQRVNSEALEALQRGQMTLQHPWSIIAAPSPPWATRVFPDLDEGEAVEALWSAVFRACRVEEADPVASWRRHVADLSARADHLTERRYEGLRYEAPGTDLHVILPVGTVWNGGNAGAAFVPNIPTEEVFAAPHRMKVNGTVAATKPLSVFGNLVDGFSFEVRNGEIIKAEATTGQAVLDQLLATDEGSTRFGEVAMVPMSSAVAAEKLIWNNTLYDENDGCHIAIGRAYPISLKGGIAMAPMELLDAGINNSTAHVDFVVGSAALNVYGVLSGGVEEPIITAGEWGFQV